MEQKAIKPNEGQVIVIFRRKGANAFLGNEQMIVSAHLLLMSTTVALETEIRSAHDPNYYSGCIR